MLILTQEDIRRAGATHVADVLRMAPGLPVARVDSSGGRITERGFNGRFANPMTLTGRSQYNHLVANGLIFHHVFSFSRILHDLQREGYPLEPRRQSKTASRF